MLDSAAPILPSRPQKQTILPNYFLSITTESSNHQKLMPRIRSQAYPWNTYPDLARSIRSEYQSMALLYNRILRHRQISVNKSDTMWNWSFNTPCKSLKGILVLFEEEKSYVRETSKYYNPKIQKVSITVEGKPNQPILQRDEII